ncbi:MAG: S8 family serine peptidase [Anaerolineales bacterium]
MSVRRSDHKLWRLGVLVLLLGLLLARGARAEPPPDRSPLELPADWDRASTFDPDYVPGQVLVLYESAAPDTARAAALDVPQVSHPEVIADDLALVQVPEGDELAVAARLSAQPGVLTAEPDYYVYAQGTPNDPYLSRQWYHTLVGSPSAWDLSTGDAALCVAIIDSGIDLTHPDLAARITNGGDYVDGGAPNDEYGHGTHIAGIVGAVTNNTVGIAGTDWRAELRIIRVLDAKGVGTTSSIVRAIDEAIANGADVINLSLATYGGPAAMQAAIDRAYAAGVVVVAAAGNDAIDRPTYPAACEHVIAVAATNRNDVYARYSNYGAYVDLAAPGGDKTERVVDGIYSTMPTYSVTATRNLGLARNYDYWQGTSMSTALVSGLSVLLLSAGASLGPDEIEDVLAKTAVDLGPKGWDQDYGWGRIDAAQAMSQITPPARVDDLSIASITGPTAGQVDLVLSWTPPANARSITIRYASTSITSANWAEAELLAADLPGSTGSFIAQGVPYTGGTLYFALRADSVRAPGILWSAVSNNAFWPPKAQLMLPLVRIRH